MHLFPKHKDQGSQMAAHFESRTGGGQRVFKTIAL